MNKKTFWGTMLLMLGDLCLLMGIIVSCASESKYVPLGVGILIAGIVVLIAGIVTIRRIEVSVNPEKIGKVLSILAVSALLHAVGIYLMVHVFWVIGLLFVFLGLISLAFIGPAVKGFEE